MPISDKELEKIKLNYGKQTPTKYLLAWANALKAVAKRDKKILDRFEDVKKFLSGVDSLMKKIHEAESAKAVKKKETPLQTKEIDSLMQQANGWRKKVMDAVLITYPFEQEIHEQFGRGVKLSSSVEKIITEIQRISSLLSLTEHKKILTLIAEKDFLKQGSQLISSLQNTDEEQEKNLKDIPSSTRETYLLKGELYLMGRQVVRIGKAFIEDSAKKKAYNYNALKRGKSAKKASKTKAKKKAETKKED